MFCSIGDDDRGGAGGLRVSFVAALDAARRGALGRGTQEQQPPRALSRATLMCPIEASSPAPHLPRRANLPVSRPTQKQLRRITPDNRYEDPYDVK